MKFALTYHLEAPRERPSREVYAEIGRQVRLADELGYDYAWFAEHHAHVHLGHQPFPLLYSLHLAGQTRRIHLGTAVICLNMHPAIAVAEQVAEADHRSADSPPASAEGRLVRSNTFQRIATNRAEWFG